MSDAVGRIAAALRSRPARTSDYDLNPGLKLPEGRPLRQAAVLIAVCDFGETPKILLTKRASGLKHHPGQIAFPGGKIDPDDDGPIAAALRESREEAGLDQALVRVIATLPSHETVTGFSVTPVLSVVSRPFAPVPEPGEVDEVFFVPLEFLLDPDNYKVERRMWLGQERAYFTVPYGPYYIWGATARMLRLIADLSAG